MKRPQFHFVLAAILLVQLLPVPARASAASSKSTTVNDGPVTATVTVDRTEARVADPIQLIVEVEAPAAARIELPTISNQLGDFEVTKTEHAKDIPATDAVNGRRSVLKARLVTLRTGDLEIPPLDVRFVPTGSNTFKSMSTRPLLIHITSVLEGRPDFAKFRDIKSTVDVSVPESGSAAWIGWTAGSAAIALAGALLLVFVTRRRASPSPADWALLAIEDLGKLKIESSAEAGAVISEIADIVREFFELEFGLMATTSTSRQFHAKIKEQGFLSEPAREALARLLSLADEVKFARLGVGAAESRVAIERARALILARIEKQQATEKGAA